MSVVAKLDMSFLGKCIYFIPLVYQCVSCGLVVSTVC